MTTWTHAETEQERHDRIMAAWEEARPKVNWDVLYKALDRMRRPVRR